MNIKKINTTLGTVDIITLSNNSGAWVSLSSLGAAIVSVNVPDTSGNLTDVVIGYDNPEYYMADGPCSGKIPGRFANRIAKGKFSLNGVEYSLPINNGPNHLHGGPHGFQNKIWNVENISDNSVCFSLVSPDGDAGYPGEVTVRATYTWDNDNTLSLNLQATTTAPTVINLTNHAYFNLSGHNSGSVLNHKLQLNASHYLPTDNTLIPTGEIADVNGTPMDFISPRCIGERINEDFPALKYGKGYDNCWIINRSDNGITQAAVLSDPVSKRCLTVLTDQPAVQIYTGNWLNGCPVGKNGAVYSDYDAVAIECQNFPDAPNHPEFPSPVLNPGETYNRTIIFKFSNSANE